MPKNTKIDIIEAFERILRKKRLEDINVKDITDECGLNRKTFYYYFTDVDNLITETFDYEGRYYFEHLPESTSIEEVMRGFFRMVVENKEIIYHIYNFSKSEHLVEYITGNVYNHYIKDIAEMAKGRNVTEFQVQLIAQAMTSIVSGYIIRWIDDEMTGDFDYIFNQSAAVVGGLQGVMLDRAEKSNKENG